MGWRRPKQSSLTYSRSARTDVRALAMFVIGVIFVVASLSIDPQDNCNDSGECAPWLIPIAFVIGAAVGLGGLGQLIANPNRGSGIDQHSGELVWWQNRIVASGGDEGRIDPMKIAASASLR
jgi:glycerol uptake facilitator-like aquaporin